MIGKNARKKFRRAQPAAPKRRTSFWRGRPAGWFLPLGLAWGNWQMARGEDHIDYRYEDYQEDHSRMKIETHSVYFEQKLIDAIIAKGELTYDSISGATPSGLLDSSGHPLTSEVRDIRKAEEIEFDAAVGRQTLTPGFAHSLESDYESYAVSLNDAIAFNEKNTILQLGLSHNFDSVLGRPDQTPRNWNGKQSTEGIIGISQLLSPKAIFTASFTFGNDSGYLNDPYRYANYIGMIGNIGVPEGQADQRPSHRNKEIVYTSLTYFIEPINGSIEGSYRFFHDSFGIYSHTAELTWHQWLGTHVIIEPRIRVDEQSAADFYSPTFYGPFLLQGERPPGIYSSDYRLSELYTLDYGVQATVVINSHVHIVGGYHRYEMHGLDGATAAGMYPKAHVINIGFSIIW